MDVTWCTPPPAKLNHPLQCHICGKWFKYKSLVARHLSSKRSCSTTKETQLTCSKCGKKFSRVDSLKRHVANKSCKPEGLHDTGLDCPFCGKVFSRIDSRKRHVATSCRRHLVADENAKLREQLKATEARLDRLERTTAAMSSTTAAGAGNDTIPVSGDTITGRDNATVNIDKSTHIDNSTNVHIHIHGQEKYDIDPELMAKLEHEIRFSHLDTPSAALMRLIDRAIWRGCQAKPENRTIRGLKGDRVGVHAGGGKWVDRNTADVAAAQLRSTEAGPIRRLRAGSTVLTPLVGRALSAAKVEEEDKSRWLRRAAIDTIEMIAENNEERAAGVRGDDLPLR